MILVIDNHDSFVQNLARYVRELGMAERVMRHETLSIATIQALDPMGIILSPGPGRPDAVPICLDVFAAFPALPILGVCLGHQCLAQHYGWPVECASEAMHGRQSSIYHDQSELFAGIDSPFMAGRYHSLIIPDSGGTALTVTARTKEGQVMALRHKDYPHFGVQFHPESVLTPTGRDLLKNFLTMVTRQAV
ncbi:MAG: anthranilate synthase component II [bacterium]